MEHDLIAIAHAALRRLAEVEAEMGRLLEEMPPGAVRAKYVRCGRSGCRCQDGQPHGPYYVARQRRDGRIEETYLGREAPQPYPGRRQALLRLRELARERDRLHAAVERATGVLRQTAFLGGGAG